MSLAIYSCTLLLYTSQHSHTLGRILLKQWAKKSGIEQKIKIQKIALQEYVLDFSFAAFSLWLC